MSSERDFEEVCKRLDFRGDSIRAKKLWQAAIVSERKRCAEIVKQFVLARIGHYLSGEEAQQLADAILKGDS